MQEIERTWVYRCDLAVRWGDMDAYGHVNNAAYFRYMEEARVQMLAALGSTCLGQQQVGAVVITAGCTFLRPIVYPNDVRIDCYLGESGRSSLMSYYELYTASAPETLACEGYAKIVWVDHDAGQSVPVPQNVKQALLAHKI